MNANTDDGRTETTARTGSKRGADPLATARGVRAVPALGRYMVVPTDRTMSATALTQRLRDLGVSEIVRTLDPQGSGLPPVAVVRLAAEAAAALRRAARGPNTGTLLVERDHALQPATASIARHDALGAITTAIPLGSGFSTTIQVQGETGQPIESALVELVGRQWTAQGVTGRDGKIALTLFGELPGRSSTVLIKPRLGYWSLCQRHAALQADGVNVIALQPLTMTRDPPWGGRAMRFDQLPAEYRAAGTRIALIDTGVAASHHQVAAIKHGFDAASGEERSWSQDSAGHGTPCAGILVASPDKDSAVRGYARDAELHACKVGLDGHLSDLLGALDYSIAQRVDIVCIDLGADRGSAIVEQRIAAAKQLGIATIAAAGSDGGAVQFPACSPLVLAVGAIGQAGAFPDDSVHALLADAPQSDLPLVAGSGLFVPSFSCAGPEIDVCAPGVAVIACQSPDGYAACDGTSLAAPHLAALAALVLAHRAEFRFHRRDATRVERLFQILKAAAQPLGDPYRTGVGLPDAPRALSLRSPSFTSWQVTAPHAGGLSELRRAMRFAGLGISGPGESEPVAEPARGPAIVAQFPLTQPPVMPTDGRGPDLRSLRDAMLRAGLAAGSGTPAGPRTS